MNAKRHAWVWCLAVPVLLVASFRDARAQSDARPSLVVMIVVDQLGEEVLERYDSVLTRGFRRFVEEGRWFTGASHEHAMTETAPGHATLATGVFPSRHGVVANNWWRREGGDWGTMYAVGDPSHPLLGFETESALEGRSPNNLLSDGLADWFLAEDSEARVVSISKKDRAAIAMGGRNSHNVWWILDELGIFVTSTYYADRYPDWITQFNEQVMPGIAADTVWRSEVPADLRVLARPDSADFEGDGVHTTFPHRGLAEVPDADPQALNVWGFDQPRADDAVLELAKVALTELELGRRPGHVDFLAVSFSALDRVGHAYGPLSQEALSTLLHVDGVLEELLSYLDDTVGEGRWVAGLAGDHGVDAAPEAGAEVGLPDARRVDQRERYAAMGDALREAAAGGGDPDSVAARLARIVMDRGLAEHAYTHLELTSGAEPADTFAVLYRNSLYPGRAWGVLSRFGVEVRYPEGDLVTPFPTGTNHGSPYWYDRHVPMMFIGAGVGRGSSPEGVYSVDFAPTLLGLGGIPPPPDVDGRNIF